MAMLDDMDKKISGWFNAGAGKAKDMSESLKISAAIREEETKQTDLYRQIGQFYFENCAEEATGQLKVWCTDVLASKAQVMQYKEQLRVLKGTVGCPNCGAEVPANSAFCNVCGTKIEKIEIPRRQMGGKICPQCGTPAEDNSAFCTACGMKLPETVQMPAFQQEQLPPMRCPGCNALIEGGQAFCTNCGRKITENSVETVPVQEEYQMPEKRKCPQCGAEIEEEQIFCTNCGARIE